MRSDDGWPGGPDEGEARPGLTASRPASHIPLIRTASPPTFSPGGEKEACVTLC